MTIVIRREKPSDVAAVSALIAGAFRTVAHASHTEHFIVDALRSAGQLSISVVAEDDGEIVGHVAVSPVTISDGTNRWYGLGPIAVLTERQREGIGSRLMERAIAELRDLDAAGCVLLGDPAFYGRFGFELEPSLVLPDAPPEYFQAIVFDGAVPVGSVSYHEAFDIDASGIAREIDGIDYSDFSVEAEHIDPNGHMNVGYYTLLFDRALDRPWERLRIYSGQMLEIGRSSFALESHLTYKRELTLGDPLDFTFTVLDHDAKRIHYWLAMLHASERWTAAICEQISMCIDMNVRRSTSWPDVTQERISALYDVHRHRPRPVEIGHVIGIRR